MFKIPHEFSIIEKMLEQGIDISLFCQQIIKAWFKRDKVAIGFPEKKLIVIKNTKSMIEKRENKIDNLKMEYLKIRAEFVNTRNPILFKEARKISNQIGGNRNFLNSCLRPYLEWWVKEYMREQEKIGYEFIGVDQDFPSITIYYNHQRHEYFGLKDGEVVKTSKNIEIEEELSVDTESQKRRTGKLTVQVKSRTLAKGNPKKLARIEGKMQKQLNKFFKQHLEGGGFDNIESDLQFMKNGITYRIMKPIVMTQFPNANVLIEKKEPTDNIYPMQQVGSKSYAVNLDNFTQRKSGIDIGDEDTIKDTREKERKIKDVL